MLWYISRLDVTDLVCVVHHADRMSITTVALHSTCRSSLRTIYIIHTAHIYNTQHVIILTHFAWRHIPQQANTYSLCCAISSQGICYLLTGSEIRLSFTYHTLSSFLSLFRCIIIWVKLFASFRLVLLDGSTNVALMRWAIMVNSCLSLKLSHSFAASVKRSI